jgi:hypothetical protein
LPDRVTRLESAAAGSVEGNASALSNPVRGDWLDLAGRLATALARDTERLLVHADLHSGNVLGSDRPHRQWVAIDPKPAADAPVKSMAELLWTRSDELAGPRAVIVLLDTLVERGRLIRAKAVRGASHVSSNICCGLGKRVHDRPGSLPAGSGALEPLATQVTLP